MLPSRTRPAKSEFLSTTTVYSVVKISSPSCVSSIWVKNAYHVNTCVAALVGRSYCSKVIIGLTAISFVNCVWRKGMYCLLSCMVCVFYLSTFIISWPDHNLLSLLLFITLRPSHIVVLPAACTHVYLVFLNRPYWGYGKYNAFWAFRLPQGFERNFKQITRMGISVML